MSSADQSASALRAQQVRVVAKLSFIDLPPECQEIAFQHLADTYQEKPLASWDKQASFPARSRMFLYPAMAWYDREVRTSKAKELEEKQLEVFVNSKKRELIQSACTRRPYHSHSTNPFFYAYPRHLYCTSDQKGLEMYAAYEKASSGRNPNGLVSTSAWENGRVMMRLWKKDGEQDVCMWMSGVVERLAYLKGGYNASNPPRTVSVPCQQYSRRRSGTAPRPTYPFPPPRPVSLPVAPSTSPLAPRAYRLALPTEETKQALVLPGTPALRDPLFRNSTPPSSTRPPARDSIAVAQLADPASTRANTPAPRPPPAPAPTSGCVTQVVLSPSQLGAPLHL